LVRASYVDPVEGHLYVGAETLGEIVNAEADRDRVPRLTRKGSASPIAARPTMEKAALAGCCQPLGRTARATRRGGARSGGAA